MGELQVYGIRSCRMMYKEVVKALSNYEKSNFWWFRILLVGIQLGVTGLKKTKVVYLLDLFEGRGENGSVI